MPISARSYSGQIRRDSEYWRYRLVKPAVLGKGKAQGFMSNVIAGNRRCCMAEEGYAVLPVAELEPG